MFGPTVDSTQLEHMSDIRIRQVYLRVRIYKISLYTAMAATVAFIFTIAIHSV